MTTLEAIQHTIAPELRQLNERILLSLASSNRMMNGIVEEYLRTKGKQIRPIMVLLSARLLGTVTPKVISAAASVEMLHNASLIHDDVVDESKLRRNEPTVNGIWDNHIAVLVGDFFVSTALQLAMSTEDLRIVDSLARLGRLLSLGELDQIYNARLPPARRIGLLRNHRPQDSIAVHIVRGDGRICHRVDDERLERLRRFAELLGICFQIKDDIFDYYEDAAVGKPTGNDLREGKITLPLLHVLLDDRSPRHDAMLALSRKEMLSTDDIDTLITYAKEQGGIEYAYAMMDKFRDEAAGIMAGFPDTDTSRALLALFDYIITRRH